MECDITVVIRGRRLLWVRAGGGVVVFIIPVSVAVELEETNSFLSVSLTVMSPGDLYCVYYPVLDAN
jgi:hypothetical protein